MVENEACDTARILVEDWRSGFQQCIAAGAAAKISKGGKCHFKQNLVVFNSK